LTGAIFKLSVGIQLGNSTVVQVGNDEPLPFQFAPASETQKVSDGSAGDAQVIEELRFMVRVKLRDGLQFDDHIFEH